MQRKCERCNVEYDDLFETVVMYDYSEPGKGKSGHYQLCLNYKKELIQLLEATK